MTPISIAFLPLTDCAVLVAAKEKGFAAEAGFDLRLIRTTSWAETRDRLVYGQAEAAHLLAPLAVGVSLGISQHRCPLAAPFKLNVNGNIFVMGIEFAQALDPDPIHRIEDPLATAHDFAAAIGLYRRKPIIGMVHRLSSHALALRYWLASAGIDPDRDVAMPVLPPSFMADALRAGEIDGYIAGSPWGLVAVNQGLAETVMVSARIWQRGVEKLLAFREEWMEANPETVDRLLVALSAAAAWCDEPENRDELAALLSAPEYINLDPKIILPSLSGRFPVRAGAPPADVPDAMIFHREAAGFPWRSQALWIYSQFVRWGFIQLSAENERLAGNVFRPDVYRRALGASGLPMPGASMKLEGSLSSPLPVGSSSGTLTLGPDRFFDGRIFDPARIEEYLASFDT